MSTINPEVYIRRNKLRRIFSQEFDLINKSISEACLETKTGKKFSVRYGPHILDRAIQREIDENYMFSLFHKLKFHAREVIDFLLMPEQDDNSPRDPSVEYRPLRLEITDGTLWLGMTVNKHQEADDLNSFRLYCRMAIINDKRLSGKISAKVIKL